MFFFDFAQYLQQIAALTAWIFFCAGIYYVLEKTVIKPNPDDKIQ